MSVNAQSEALVRRWFKEVWNERNVAASDQLLTEDIVFHNLGPSGLRGREQFKAFHQAMCAAFDDLHFEVLHVLATGDLLAAYCTLEGRHRATGRTVSIPGGGFARIRDGRIAETWDVWDFKRLLEQVGTLQADAMQQVVPLVGDTHAT